MLSGTGAKGCLPPGHCQLAPSETSARMRHHPGRKMAVEAVMNTKNSTTKEYQQSLIDAY